MVVKRAHMVSKGYIRAWADERNRVDVLDLQDGRGYPSSVENATVVSYGYDTGVLSRNLEIEYGLIENRGIPALTKLRNGQMLTAPEQGAVVAFLDMHRDRGRFADQTKIRVPAVVLKVGGRVEDADLTLGDRLLLSGYMPEALKLDTLGLEQWLWQVREAQHLATGDGAVLLWEYTSGSGISTVSFPLSPTQLLLIGQDLPGDVAINSFLAMNSKRWIVGVKGTLRFDAAANIATRRLRK